MANRLLVDIALDGRATVTVCPAGELPSVVGKSVELSCPLGPAELADLRWYLEDYLEAPMAVYEKRGTGIAARLSVWGQALFTLVFGAGPVRDAYVHARAGGTLEIVVRSRAPGWLGLPWELMADPARPAPLVLDGIALSRSLPRQPYGTAFPVGGARLRVLMVISRPAGTADVAYRMIARPLLARLAAVAGRVDLVVLRPPTLDALHATLGTAREAGEPFQIVHFDGHGVLAGSQATALDSDDTPDGGGVLLFEKPEGGADPVAAEQLGRVLADARVPVVVLNACQSGAVGRAVEAAVATRLLEGGAAAVVAMAYRVYTVAAAEFMAAFYERLFAGDTVGDAVRAGRTRMAARPQRPSPVGDLPLEDWLIPVHYLRAEVRFPDLLAEPAAPGRSTLDEALDRLRVRPPGEHDNTLAPAEEFIGRDGMIYSLEVASRTRRVIVLHGSGGTGKTELGKAFGRWWRDTAGVDRPDWVFWHSFEAGAGTPGLAGVLNPIGAVVFGPDFHLRDEATQRELVLDHLARHRVLLIWDNFEVVESMPTGTARLDEHGRAEFAGFLPPRSRPRCGRPTVPGHQTGTSMPSR